MLALPYDTPLIETESSEMPAPNAHVHLSRPPKPVRGPSSFQRMSCHDVPVLLVARRRRMPSSSESGRVLFNKPSMILLEYAATPNASVPLGVVAMADCTPWPVDGQFHPSRPRPTSTQPPPSVVMSQYTRIGAIRAGVWTQ